MKEIIGMTVMLLSMVGCAASRASNRDVLPPENVTQCRALCESAAMTLQSIVVVANQTGCVCGPAVHGGAAAATGGAVAVMMAQRAQQQQQQQQHY